MKAFVTAAMIGLAAAAGIGAGAAPADAATKVKFRVVLGVPYYTYRVGPDYVYRSGYGWYRPANRNRVGNITCSRAATLVSRAGFKSVSRVECAGSTYTFRATRNGKRVTVLVNSRNGAVYR